MPTEVTISSDERGFYWEAQEGTIVYGPFHTRGSAEQDARDILGPEAGPDGIVFYDMVFGERRSA
jgi:hypothetical protein